MGVIKTLRRFEVDSYQDLYALYVEKRLGVTEQRLPENIEFDVDSRKSDLEKIVGLLDLDNEWIYSVIKRDEVYEIIVHEITINVIPDTKIKPNTTLLIYYGEDGVQREIMYPDEVDNSGETYWVDVTNDFSATIH